MRRVKRTGLMAAALVFATTLPALAQKPAADPGRTRVEVLGKSFTTAFNLGDFAAVAALY